jgi:four helix bundle protein
MAKTNILKDKSFAFALRIVKLYQFLMKEHHEFVFSKQTLRSGTAIGALVRESEHGSTKKDFIYKLTVALKESSETEYWLELLHADGYIEKKLFTSIKLDCEELIKLLVASIKTARSKIN